MSSRLEEIVAHVRSGLPQRQRDLPSDLLQERIAKMGPTHSLLNALRRPGKKGPLRVIGELKRQSPSAGAIREDLDIEGAARELEAASCAALSVLTEEKYFGGSLENLERARRAVKLPLLRKDFLVEPYQLLEARVAGADAVLLLAAVLEDTELMAMVEAARRLGLDCLCEAHGEEEFSRLLALDLPLLGLNCRDLHTFELDLPRALRWARMAPAESVLVAESGVLARADAEAVAAAPVDACLVGEGLMRGATPAKNFERLFGGLA